MNLANISYMYMVTATAQLFVKNQKDVHSYLVVESG